MINFGIVPMVLKNPDDYEKFEQGDKIEIQDFAKAVESETQAKLVNKTTGFEAELVLNFTKRQREMLLAGGCLNYTKNSKEK